ncbi:MAG: LDCC motif putative metal-binding protein [Bacillota bacterium]|nr:LDCC motif putative metal-binding protein [Bacillota bacterium]
MKEQKKGWLGRFIQRLADASDREFHGTPPKCCGNPEIKKIGDRSSKAER